MMSRPAHLPEFENPPVNEVVLGVQFRTPVGYQQINAGTVWDIFKAEYPNVEEHPPLAPQFETFGPRTTDPVPFNLITGASHDRFWFVSESGCELIQFQEDRMLHNWRKMGVPENAYPRFEAMIVKFEAELRKFDSFVQGLVPQALEINQCEVTYINHMLLPEIKGSRPSTWLKGFELPAGGPDDFAYVFRRPISDATGKPTGRLNIEIVSALTKELEPAIRLTITARGSPASPAIADSIKYLTQGREMIVMTFAEITSDVAQKHWGRLK